MPQGQLPFVDRSLAGIKLTVSRQVRRHEKTKEVIFVPDIVTLTRSQYDALIEMAEKGVENAQGA